jgi:hypothetical protein
VSSVGPRLGIFAVQAAGVQVPARHMPRSPFAPPRTPWNPR